MNKIQCKLCLDVIESKSRHHFLWCKCGAVAVDGGWDYKRRVGDPKNILEINDELQTGRSGDCSTGTE